MPRMNTSTAVERACELAGGTSALARALEVAGPTVSEWRKGERPVPVERCVQIERVTGGAVTRMDLRPDDWHRIWPELAAANPGRVPPSAAAPAQQEAA